MWEDLFSSDTWDTIQRGVNTAGSAFNTLAPIINRGAQLAAGIEGTRNAGQLAAARQQAQQSLDQLFTPGGEYAQELRKQLERRDAAAGRRSQYGTRETELMARLAKDRASVLTNPQYAAHLTGAQQSPYGPLAGAVGSLTGGQQQQSGTKIPNTPPGTSNALNYLYDTLFAPAADASIAGLGGAGQALGATGLGDVGLMGAEGVSGMSGLLPGYAEAGGPQATGIFGDAGSAGAGALTGAGDLAAASLGGAGSALSGMGAGSLAGTVGATDALGALAGGTGFLPSYGAAGGAQAAGLFGGGAAAAEGAAGAAGAAGAGGASGSAAGAAGAGLAPYGAALPIAVLIGGLLSMFQSGTSPEDIAGGLKANQGNLNQQNFRQYQAENPYLNALVNESMTNGQFDLNKYSQMAQRSNIGGKQFTGQALQDVLGFGQTLQQNPNWFQGPAATHSDWQSDLAATYGGG